jgi:MFS family permease
MQETSSRVTSVKPSYAEAWLVCLVAALYFFYIFIQMTKFNAIGQELMVDFKIGSTGLGTLASAYFWGNLIFLFPAGLLLDRFSTKKILFVNMVIAIVTTFFFSFTHGVPSAWICFLLLGLAGAFGLLIPLRLISRWFPPEKMASVSGVAITIGFLGALVSQTPLTWLVGIMGWRHAIQVDALLGVVLLVIMMLSVKDYPPGMQAVSSQQAMSLSFLWDSIKKSLANRQNWLFGIYTCLLNLPIFVFGAVFGARYLEQIHHVTKEQASFAMVLMFLGAMIGSSAFGWASDKLKCRKVPMFLGGIISLLIIFIIMYVSNLSYLILYVLFFGIGFFTSGQVITYPVIAESNPLDLTATSSSIGSILIMSGGAVFVPVFGLLLDAFWNGQMVDNVPIHTLANYTFALWMLPIAFIVGMLAIAFGKETFCKRIG